MGELWLGNIESDTTDDEIRQFLCNYGFPPFDSLQRIPGTGERPAMLVTFDSVESHVLRSMQPRIHNLFWKNRTLTVQVMPERDES
jgi:hypothetical protein